MKKIGHQKGSENATVPNILWGILLSSCTSIVLCILIAALIEKEVLPITVMGAGILIIHTVSTFVGSMLSTALEKGKPAVICTIISASYIAVLLCINLLFFSSGFKGTVAAIVAAFIGGAMSCAVKMGIGSKPKRHKRVFAR